MAAFTPLGFVPVLLGYALATVTMLGLAGYAIRTDSGDATLRAFAALLVTIALWSFAVAGRVLAGSTELTLLFHYLGYVGIASAPVAWLVFALRYTGRGQYVSGRLVAALSVVPACALVLVVTNYRQLFYTSVGTVSVGSTTILTIDVGPAFWAWTVYAYLLVLFAIGLLVTFAATSERLYRLQSVALTTAAILPLGVNAVFLSGLVENRIDPTPITFALSGLLIGVAVFYGQFGHLLPIARETIVETLDDGIVVVDDSGTIAYTNPAARTLLPAGGDGRLVGHDAAAILPWDEITTDAGTTGTEVSLDTGAGPEWYWFRQIGLDTGPAAAGEIYMFTDVTEQKELEQRLRALQRTHQELMTAETVAEIGDIVTTAAREILDLPVTGLWQADAERGALVPVTTTAEAAALVGEAPTLYPGSSLGWQTFERNQLRVFGDVSEEDRVYDRETSIRSEIQVPVGDHGLIMTGSEEPREFENTNIELVRILAAATERAFSRTEREVELRDREARLERKNERLEEFTSVVAHDLRSPLNSADIFLEKLTNEYDDRRIERVASVHERTTEMVEDLLALAKQGATVEEPEPVEIGTVVDSAWGSIVTHDAGLVVADDCNTVLADRSRLRQVFENLFRNAVEHGSTSPDSQARRDAVEHGSAGGREPPADDAVTVRVGTLSEGGGFFVADDGPGIPAAERSEVFDHGYTRSADGTGFGLAIVRRIVEAHGWRVGAEESTDGGLRIEIRTETADESAPPDPGLAG